MLFKGLCKSAALNAVVVTANGRLRKLLLTVEIPLRCRILYDSAKIIGADVGMHANQVCVDVSQVVVFRQIGDYNAPGGRGFDVFSQEKLVR